MLSNINILCSLCSVLLFLVLVGNSALFRFLRSFVFFVVCTPFKTSEVTSFSCSLTRSYTIHSTVSHMEALSVVHPHQLRTNVLQLFGKVNGCCSVVPFYSSSCHKTFHGACECVVMNPLEAPNAWILQSTFHSPEMPPGTFSSPMLFCNTASYC